MRKRLRAEQGFGLIELMISMVMLNVGILAIVAAFNSGGLAIQRASETSSATVVADQQMELYRALTHANIALLQSALTTAGSDSVYTTDGAYSATQAFVTTCPGTPLPDQCDPRRTATGPDGRSYRVDTYIVAESPPNGRPVKRVTVVARRPSDMRSLARITSIFDESTG